jgi:hypothetical protein
MAAICKPQAIGPWDRQPVRSAGRLANYLDLHAERFIALALKGALVPFDVRLSRAILLDVAVV